MFTRRFQKQFHIPMRFFPLLGLMLSLMTVPAAWADEGADADADAAPEGWAEIDGETYYYEHGEAALGERYLPSPEDDAEAWYYFDPAHEGAMVRGWFTLSSADEDAKTVFYDDRGRMLHGEGCLDGHWYYFDQFTGAMDHEWAWIPDADKWVYYDPVTGWMLYGEQYLDGHWYYLDDWTGATTYGFKYLPQANKWVYYDRPMGWMLYGEQCIDGHWYYLDDWTGAVNYGFKYLPAGNKWVFYDRVMGWMLYGEQFIDGGWYYLTPGTGAVDYGWAWLPDSSRWVYYDKISGRMQSQIYQEFRAQFDHGPKPAANQRYIVLHDTEGDGNALNTIHWWEMSGNLVASHFVVNKDGSIYQCVQMDRIAHHAGYGNSGHNAFYGIFEDGRDDMRGSQPIGSWAADYAMNAWSIGIEMVHVGGSGYYPEAQLDAVDRLIELIDENFGFQSTIIDHKDWRSGNSDTSPEFARYLANYKNTRRHNG